MSCGERAAAPGVVATRGHGTPLRIAVSHGSAVGAGGVAGVGGGEATGQF